MQQRGEMSAYFSDMARRVSEVECVRMGHGADPDSSQTSVAS